MCALGVYSRKGKGEKQEVPGGRPGKGDWTEGFSVPSEQWRGAWLTVLNGAAKGRTFRLGDRITTIGRLHNNHVQLVDTGVSRRHAQIRPIPGGFEIQDMSSMAGTVVRGEKIESTRLASEVDIVLGSVRIRFEPNASYPVDHGLARKEIAEDTQKETDYVDTNQMTGTSGGSLRDRLLTLGQVTAIAGGKGDRKEKLSAAAKLLLSELSAHRVLFLAGSQEGWKLEAHFSAPGERTESKNAQPHRQLMSQTVASGDATCFENRAGAPGVPGAALCAPVFKDEVIIGLLYADRVETPAKLFNQSDAEFAEQVGQTLGNLAQ